MSFSVTVYITTWCSDCSRSKRFLNRSCIPFEEVDIERSESAEATMREINGGSGKVPTILIVCDEQRVVLVEPSDAELKQALCEMEDEEAERHGSAKALRTSERVQ